MEELQPPAAPMDDMPRKKRVVETQKKTNGYGSEPKAPPPPPPPPIRYAGEALPLKELRAALPHDAAAIVKRATEHFERELITAWPELTAGIRTSASEGSFSATLQITSAKKGRLKGKMTARVRTPREALEIDMHLDTTGQLALGLGPESDDDDEE